MEKITSIVIAAKLLLQNKQDSTLTNKIVKKKSWKDTHLQKLILVL